VLPVITLKMRKLSAIEGLKHWVYVGTAALGCPAERSSALLKSSGNGRSAVRGS